MKKALGAGALVTLLLGLGGCATVSGSGPNQSLSVETFASDGAQLDGARCEMTNDEGTWFVVSPGSTVVHRSNKDLRVTCKKPGVDVGTASVVSRTTGNMWGNIILGGGVGALIDHNNGTAYEYPGIIRIFMGRANQRIEATPSGAAQAQAAAPAGQGASSPGGSGGNGGTVPAASPPQ